MWMCISSMAAHIRLYTVCTLDNADDAPFISSVGHKMSRFLWWSCTSQRSGTIWHIFIRLSITDSRTGARGRKLASLCGPGGSIPLVMLLNLSWHCWVHYLPTSAAFCLWDFIKCRILLSQPRDVSLISCNDWEWVATGAKPNLPLVSLRPYGWLTVNVPDEVFFWPLSEQWSLVLGEVNNLFYCQAWKRHLFITVAM